MIPEVEKKELVLDFSDNRISNTWLQRKNNSSYIYQGSYSEDVWTIGPDRIFMEELIESISGANEVICLSSFILGASELETALLKAAENGIRVYILSAPQTILKKEIISEEDNFDIDQRILNYKAFLDRIAGWLLLRSADHFHSKFLLVDPHDTDRARGYLSTANFDSALWQNPEIGIRLKPQEIDALYRQFHNGFWNEASGELLKKEMFRPINSTPSWVSVSTEFGPLLCTVNGPRTGKKVLELREAVANFIASSRGPLIISTYGIDLDHEITKQILHEATYRKVTLITRPRIEQMDVHRLLVESGVTVVGHPNHHAKAIAAVRNGKVAAIVMTANLQRKGLDEGFETGILLSDRRAFRVNLILREWEMAFPYEFIPEITLGNIDAPVLIAVGDRIEQSIVSPQITVEGPRIIQTTLENEELPEIDPKDHPLTKSIRVAYEEKRPLLPSGAKLMKDNPHELPVYSLGKQQFIAIREESQLPTAIELKKNTLSKAAIVISRSD